MTLSLRRWLCFGIGFAALLTAHAATAASISQARSFAFDGTTSQGSTKTNSTGFGTFNDFNTTLGTLTSVTLTFTGSGSTKNSGPSSGYALSGSFIGSNGATAYVLSFPTQAIDGNADGAQFEIAAIGSTTSASDLLQFEGFGTLELAPIFTADSGGVDYLIPSLSAQVVYTYTPPPPPGLPTRSTGVPEPTSATLLGIGVAGLLAARRRRGGR